MKLKFILMMWIGSCQLLNAQEHSYVWANQFPALAAPPIECCFDFDGDMQDDDQNGAVMASLQSLLSEDFQLIADTIIINNDYVRVWRWNQLPQSDGPVVLTIMDGTVSNPGITLADRIDGLTQVVANPNVSNVFSGTMTGGVIELTADQSEMAFFLPFTLAAIGIEPVEGGGGGPTILLPMSDVRIFGNLNQDAPGCQGVCSDTINGTDPALLGALEISGLVHHSDEIDTLNEVASDCTCAGVDPQIPLIDYGEDNQSLNFSCNYNDLDQTQCDDTIPFCQSVEDTCGFTAILQSFYDQDTNNNGVSDSKSVGGLLGISGATVTGVVDLIFADDFE